MAAYANYLRVARLGMSSGVNLSTLRSICAPNPTFDRTLLDQPSTSSLLSYSLYRQSHARFISQLVKSNGKRLFLVDTLALVRSLEAQGLPSKQAEAITGAITEVLNDSLGVVSQLVVSKGEMQKAEMTQEANLSKFKSEINSSLDHHFSLLQHENEKLHNDIERIRTDIRHEIDKVTAGQRLDLNLEKGRIRDELTNQNAETSNLTNKLDRVGDSHVESSIGSSQVRGDQVLYWYTCLYLSRWSCCPPHRHVTWNQIGRYPFSDQTHLCVLIPG